LQRQLALIDLKAESLLPAYAQEVSAKRPVQGWREPVIVKLLEDRAKFAASFAAEVSAPKAQFMADSQVPRGVNALNDAISEPAWKKKPSWYLVATEDKMIPPPARREMSKLAGSSTVEARGSHAIYVSQPKAVAASTLFGSEASARSKFFSASSDRPNSCSMAPRLTRAWA
jgi:pimeloyl-ACP methyl ester carboxylesterase